MWNEMYSHMSGFGSAWFGYGLMHMAVFWTALVFLLIAALWYLSVHRRGDGHRSDNAVDILEQRFARGEIDKGEFQEKMNALRPRR